MTNDLDPMAEAELELGVEPGELAGTFPSRFRRALVKCEECGRMGTRAFDCLLCQYDSGLL